MLNAFKEASHNKSTGFSFPEIKSIRNSRFYLKTHFDLKVKTVPYRSVYKLYTVSLAGFFPVWKTVVQLVLLL